MGQHKQLVCNVCGRDKVRAVDGTLRQSLPEFRLEQTRSPNYPPNNKRRNRLDYPALDVSLWKSSL